MEKIDIFLFVVLVISVIVFFGALFIDFTDFRGVEVPFSQTFFFGGDEIAPPDRIKEDQIHIYEDRVVIEIKNAKWAGFAPTKSMVPFLDEGSNALQIVPESSDQIEVGDIVSYESRRESLQGAVIIHRVIEKHKDEQGDYFIVKGDNNSQPDPEKVRFNQIKRVLIGVIY
ncbi:signal peptidase I [Candidatus Woesearchaeota archaeon]|nr:signal peptidase I [Candidatus Woesearchaeota archaeon]